MMISQNSHDHYHLFLQFQIYQYDCKKLSINRSCMNSTRNTNSITSRDHQSYSQQTSENIQQIFRTEWQQRGRRHEHNLFQRTSMSNENVSLQPSNHDSNRNFDNTSEYQQPTQSTQRFSTKRNMSEQ